MQQAQPRAHHERVRLAAKISLPPRRHLDGRDERAARRGDAVFDRTGDVRVRADELCARQHKVRRLCQRLDGVSPALADDNIVRVHVVHRDPGVIERVQKSRLADGEHGAAGRLVAQERRGRERAGVKMLLRHVQSHAGELLVQLPRGVAAVVREEEILLVLLVQPPDKLRHAGQNAVPVVDHAVHVADEALFLVEVHAVGCHSQKPPCGFLLLYHGFLSQTSHFGNQSAAV